MVKNYVEYHHTGRCHTVSPSKSTQMKWAIFCRHWAFKMRVEKQFGSVYVVPRNHK